MKRPPSLDDRFLRARWHYDGERPGPGWIHLTVDNARCRLTVYGLRLRRPSGSYADAAVFSYRSEEAAAMFRAVIAQGTGGYALADWIEEQPPVRQRLTPDSRRKVLDLIRQI